MTNNIILDQTRSLESILSADVTTLKFSNKNNEVSGALIHHHAFQYPVKVLTQQLAHLHANKTNPDTVMCAYFDHLEKDCVTNGNMLKGVQAAAVGLELEL